MPGLACMFGGIRRTLLLLALTSVIGGCGAPPGAGEIDWPNVGGDKAFTRQSPAGLISADNVQDLEIAWRRPAVDASFRDGLPGPLVSSNLRATLAMIDGVLYATNGVGLAEAFDPTTGETVWVQKPANPTLGEVSGPSTRGLAYWTDGSERRLLLVRKGVLHALDARDGSAIEDLGRGGRVDLLPPGARSFAWSSGPIVVADVIVVPVGGREDLPEWVALALP